MNRYQLGAAGAAIAGALAIATPVVAGATTATPITGNSAKAQCNGVINPGPGVGVSKELVGTPVPGHAPDGTAVVTYTFKLTVLGPGKDKGKIHVIDCAVEVPAMTTPKTLKGRTVAFSTDTTVAGPLHTTTVSLTVPADVRICDEAKITGSGHDNRSNIVCNGPVSPPPVVPDVPATALLVPFGAMAMGGVWLVNRRRQAGALSA